MPNNPTELDAIKTEAEKSSLSSEELAANATSETSSKENGSVNDVKKEPSVQEAVAKILGKARNEDSTKPEGDDQPDNEQTDGDDKGNEEDSTDSSTETKIDDEKETTSDEEAKVEGDEKEAETNDDGKKKDETVEEKQLREARELIAKHEGKSNVPDEQLPFHKHPRFQQLINENRTLKQTTSEFQNIDKYRKENNIDEDTFGQALTLAALSKKNPQEFVKTLRSIVDEQEVQLGIKLPADLQKKVDDQLLDVTDAKEIAKLRVEKTLRERGETTSKQRVEQQRITSVSQALNTIGYELQKKDPTFKPKTNGGPDGVWEFALKSFTLLQASKPASNAMEATQQFTQCYNEVKQLISSYIPRRSSNRAFNSRSQRDSRASGLTPSSRKNGDDSTITGAVNDVLKKHGIKIRPTSESSGSEN